jgi:hypothetical protein
MPFGKIEYKRINYSKLYIPAVCVGKFSYLLKTEGWQIGIYTQGDFLNYKCVLETLSF